MKLRLMLKEGHCICTYPMKKLPAEKRIGKVVNLLQKEATYSFTSSTYREHIWVLTWTFCVAVPVAM